MASDTDPLHLAAMVGLDGSIVIRYAAFAGQLLQRPHEDDLVAWPRTHVPSADNASDEHSSSC